MKFYHFTLRKRLFNTKESLLLKRSRTKPKTCSVKRSSWGLGPKTGGLHAWSARGDHNHNILEGTTWMVSSRLLKSEKYTMISIIYILKVNVNFFRIIFKKYALNIEIYSWYWYYNIIKKIMWYFMCWYNLYKKQRFLIWMVEKCRKNSHGWSIHIK